MATALVGRLEEFAARSLLAHAIMVVTFLAAIASAVALGDSRIGLVSFVAFLNFTAGMWVAHSIHALGNAATDDDYDGVLGAARRYVG